MVDVPHDRNDRRTFLHSRFVYDILFIRLFEVKGVFRVDRCHFDTEFARKNLDLVFSEEVVFRNHHPEVEKNLDHFRKRLAYFFGEFIDTDVFRNFNVCYYFVFFGFFRIFFAGFTRNLTRFVTVGTLLFPGIAADRFFLFRFLRLFFGNGFGIQIAEIQQYDLLVFVIHRHVRNISAENIELDPLVFFLYRSGTLCFFGTFGFELALCFWTQLAVLRYRQGALFALKRLNFFFARAFFLDDFKSGTFRLFLFCRRICFGDDIRIGGCLRSFLFDFGRRHITGRFFLRCRFGG